VKEAFCSKKRQSSAQSATRFYPRLSFSLKRKDRFVCFIARFFSTISLNFACRRRPSRRRLRSNYFRRCASEHVRPFLQERRAPLTDPFFRAHRSSLRETTECFRADEVIKEEKREKWGKRGRWRSLFNAPKGEARIAKYYIHNIMNREGSQDA